MAADARPSAPSRAGQLLLGLGLACLSAGCLGPQRRPGDDGYQAPTQISGRTTFASTGLDPRTEVEHLRRATSRPALLRRGWLELQLNQPDAALDTASEVLYAPDRPSTHDESFARFLRAEAYRLKGAPERGKYDRDRARQLALDPELQRRLGRAQPGNAGGTPWGDLTVFRRSKWRPRQPNRRKLNPMKRPTRLTIHHSAMYFRDTGSRDAAGQISRIQHQHMNAPTRRYGDIGYHFLIDPSGRIWEGRELRYQGAHAGGASNIGNIGICLLGNFIRNRDGQDPTRPQIASMQRLAVQLMQHYGIASRGLYCHSDFKATECPGPRMRPVVRRLAARLRASGQIPTSNED